MRFAYADPPYAGQARKHYGTAEVDQGALVRRLVDEFVDVFPGSGAVSRAHGVWQQRRMAGVDMAAEVRAMRREI